MNHPDHQLLELQRNDLLRTLAPLDSPTGPQVTRNGSVLWNFASNDYLGLAHHPAIAEAWIDGIRQFGSGSAASRLVCGTLPSHTALEHDLALAKHTESSLVFSSGFATALGAIPAIVGKNDFIFLDKLCHACLVDASKLSGATLRVFPHNHLPKLRSLLASHRAKFPSANILILAESVYSMDGDVAPLTEIVELAEEFNAWTLIDEAHAFGVLGPTGMGLAEQLNLQSRITFQMGTFSKAAGLSGGYLASSHSWIQLLINRARSFIYSTAPPPALAHATRASLQIIQSATGADLRSQLFQNLSYFHHHPTPIIPIILGSNESALHASRQLAQEGFMIPAIRYPTVPRGQARLRLSISAAHPPSAIEALQAALQTVTTRP